MYWVFYQLENPIFDILHDLSHAKDMSSFEDNLAKVVSPGLNFSYAGYIGQHSLVAAGKLPVRDPRFTLKKF